MSDDDSEESISFNAGPTLAQGFEFSEVEWEEVVENSQVSKALINSLILEYFVIGSFKDAAVEFMKESFIDLGVDMNSVHERECIRSNIISGDFLGAIDLINRISPTILQDNQHLLLDMYHNHFASMLFSGSTQDAIKFAKCNLAPLVMQNPLLLKDVEEIMSLVIYSDIINDCPIRLRSKTSESKRHDLADSLNRAILEYQGHSVEPELFGVLRQLVNTQNEMSTKGTSARTGDAHNAKCAVNTKIASALYQVLGASNYSKKVQVLKMHPRRKYSQEVFGLWHY